jgi:hypothetical protein
MTNPATKERDILTKYARTEPATRVVQVLEPPRTPTPTQALYESELGG